jgi:pimeloyl-ACP methyl ester carboxylesterase
MPPPRDATIRLGDGRALAYAEWGDRQGAPVLLFHGTPMSRLWCPDENVTAASRVRLLTIDRPGIGRSDVLPRRTFGDWPGDVAEFGDVLGIDEFGVVGWSAGGPYAAACAARIPDRLTGVAIGACRALSRFNFAENPAAREELPADDRRLFELAQEDPEAAARAAAEADQEWVRALWDDAEGWLAAAELPPVDRAGSKIPSADDRFWRPCGKASAKGRRRSRGSRSTPSYLGASDSRTSRSRFTSSTAHRTRGSSGVTSTSSSRHSPAADSPSGRTRGTARHATGARSSTRSPPTSAVPASPPRDDPLRHRQRRLSRHRGLVPEPRRSVATLASILRDEPDFDGELGVRLSV